MTGVACPTCKARPVAKDGNKVYPFCSERCHLVDLGKWLDEEFRVPTDETLVPPTEE